MVASDDECPIRRRGVQLLPGNQICRSIYKRIFDMAWQNYTQDCLSNAVNDCQQQIVDVDSSSSFSIYSLATVGTTYQLSVSEKGIINQSMP
jgi:hypothetical protein